jgi:hypothetical protein
MGNPFRVVLLCLTLLAATEISAQQIVVYSVEGWPRMGPRPDGKLEANSFVFGVQRPAATVSGGMRPGKVNVQDGVLSLPVGDPALAFMRALFGERLKSVLIEFQKSTGDTRGPAPFAARLTDVFVTAVNLSKSGSDGGPGIAEVRLQPQKIELFTSVIGPDGSARPGASLKYDVNVSKPL